MKTEAHKIAYKGSESPYLTEQAVSTGLPSLDWAIGIGGIPRGRITEFVGNKSTGKTTLVLTMIKTAQQVGLRCVYADSENAVNFKKAKSLGVDLDKLTVLHGSFGEEYLDEILRIVEADEADLIVVDSVAALSPRVEFEGTAEQQTIGAQARMISKFCRKVILPLRKHNVALVLINHSRLNIMTNVEESAGGKSLEYYRSVQVRLKIHYTKGALKSGDKTVGNKIVFKITKNKAGGGAKEVAANLFFDTGHSAEADLIETGLEMGVIKKEGNTLYFGDTKLGVGMEKVRKYLEDNPDLTAEIKDKMQNS